MRKSILLSLALCAVALAAHVPMLLRIPTDEWIGIESERVAASLARGEGWSNAFAEGTGPTAHVPPAYPFILSVLYRVAGTYETPSGRLAQQCMSLASVVASLLLLPIVGRKLGFSENVAWAAAFLAACLPGNWRNAVSGHYEQNLAASAMLGLLWLCAHLQEQSFSNRRAALAMGALMGVVALLCPNLLLVPALFLVGEFVCRRDHRKQIVFSAAIMAAISLAMIAPWAIRNYYVLGGFVPLRSNFGLELAIGNRPNATGHTYAPGFDDMHPFANPDERKRLAILGERKYMAEKQRAAVQWIEENPAQFCRLTLRRAMLFWFTPDERWYRLEPKLTPQARIYGVLGFALALNLARCLRKRPATGRLLTAAALGAGIPYFVTHVEMRYRLPIVGLSALATCDLAAAALGWIRAKLPHSKPQSPQFSPPQSRAA